MTKVVKDMLVREEAMNKNVDPMGRRLACQHIAGSALYEVKVVEGPSFGGGVPQQLVGKFTHPDRVFKQIRLYLIEAWDKNDEAAKKLRRKKRASPAKESTGKEEDIGASPG